VRARIFGVRGVVRLGGSDSDVLCARVVGQRQNTFESEANGDDRTAVRTKKHEKNRNPPR
jgi:hypothetical protein